MIGAAFLVLVLAGCGLPRVRHAQALQHFRLAQDAYKNAYLQWLEHNDSARATVAPARDHFLVAYSLSGRDAQYAVFLPDVYSILQRPDSQLLWQQVIYSADSARGFKNRGQRNAQLHSMATAAFEVGDTDRLKTFVRILKQYNPNPGRENGDSWEVPADIFKSETPRYSFLRTKGIDPCGYGLAVHAWLRDFYADQLAGSNYLQSRYAPETARRWQDSCARH